MLSHTPLQAPSIKPGLVAVVLGTLASLDIRGYDYLGLLQATRMHTWLLERMLSPDTPDAVVLEAVAAVGTLCTEATAAMLAEAGLVSALHGLVVQRMDDDEFVLRTTLTAHRLLQHAPTREALLERPELAAHFAELLEHASHEVARAADSALDCVVGLSDEWAASVRRLRFEAHNRLWIEHIEGDAALDQSVPLAEGWQ